MANLILFLDRLITLYLYFVVGSCFLALVPNINPDYPMFHYIFKFAGFYLIPTVLGVSISPALVMLVAALISMGLNKVYMKYFSKDKESRVLVISQDELLEKLNKEKRKDSEDDCTENH
ncbi:hypothetical protein HDR58_02075 [bacterium]|nr:hypothetical protein [bacterium]